MEAAKDESQPKLLAQVSLMSLSTVHKNWKCSNFKEVRNCEVLTYLWWGPPREFAGPGVNYIWAPLWRHYFQTTKTKNRWTVLQRLYIRPDFDRVLLNFMLFLKWGPRASCPSCPPPPARRPCLWSPVWYFEFQEPNCQRFTSPLRISNWV